MAVRTFRHHFLRIGVVQHPDPVRRATSGALAYVLVVFMVSSVFAIVGGPLAGAPPAGTIGTVVFGIIIFFLWKLNARGSLLPPWIFAGGVLLLLPFTFAPETYIDVAGYPVVHLLFVLPVLVVTFFAHPSAGLLVIPLQIGALTFPLIGVYSSELLWRFSIIAALNLSTVYAISAALSAFLRNSLREMHKVNMSLEERVADRTRDLLERNEQLAAARSSLSSTMRQVAHDLNNMLQLRASDAWVLADLIQNGDYAAALQHCDTLDDSTRTLARLVADIHESSVAVAGSLVLMPQATNLTTLSTKAVREFSRSPQVQFTVEAPDDDQDAMAWCDPDRIYRVLLNIVGNAIKFQGTEIVLRVYPDQNGVIWECRDNGIGINPEKLHLMGKEFERLVHGDGAPGGTGIGLHFCGIIVGLSKGEITYFSDGEGKGTTVSLFLPRPLQTVVGILPELVTEV